MWPFKKKKQEPIPSPDDFMYLEPSVSDVELPAIPVPEMKKTEPAENTLPEMDLAEPAALEPEAQADAPEEEPAPEAAFNDPGEEFSLDSLMREFSDTPAQAGPEEEAGEAPADAPSPVTGDTIRVELPAQAVHEAQGEVTGDTIRVDVPDDVLREIQSVVSGDTIRVDLPDGTAQNSDAFTNSDTIRMDLPNRETSGEDVSGDTVRFTPVGQEGEEPAAEPFSEGWEPEYEQPIGEYIPPQPILFHPRSRLRELKRKLVAGPERRYYELSEQGFVRLQLAIFITLAVAVLSTAATLLYDLGMLTGRVKLVAFGQLFGMLIAALMGTYQLMDGVADIFKKRFSLNSLLVFSFLACIADGVFCLKAQRIPCCAAFTLQMTMSLWNAYHQRTIELGQMDTLRKATRLDSIVEEEDYHDGCTGLLRGEGQVEDFMDHYQERSKADKITSIYALCACGVSLISAVVTGLLRGSLEVGLQVLTTSLLVAVPGTFFISQSRPMAILEKRLHKLGTVLCGWQRIARLSRRAIFPLSHEDLFPAGSIMLNGVKFYGSRDPDQVVAYATAVIAADGGGLTPLFEHLLSSRNGRSYEVENLRLYGGGGIGGEVCGEPVLVGMQSFLKEMGVEIPEGTMVSQAVYVAVDGELSGVFAVSATRTKSAAQGLHTLCGYRSLRPMLVTDDFMLTEAYIHEKFGINTRRFAFPEFEVRAELATKRPAADAPALALATKDGLAGFAYAVTGARSVQTAAMIGTVIHLLGGVLGLGIVLTLTLLNATALLTPVNMLLYQLIWMIPGLLVTEWTRVL